MKVYEVTGTGLVDTLWSMSRVSGEVQQITLFHRLTGVPSANLLIQLIPSGGIEASGDVFTIYDGPSVAGPPGAIINFVANGPFTLRVRSGSSGAGGYVVYAQ